MSQPSEAGTPKSRASLEVNPDGVDESELLADIKHWRTGRATRSLSEALSRGYIVLFAVVMFGAMIANVVVTAQVSVSSCDGTTCVSARTVLPWAAVAFAVAIALFMSRLFGPVVASAAEGFWLMDAPVRRGRLLGKRLFAVVIVVTLVGAALAALVTALSGAAPAAIGMWTAASGLAAGASVAFAAAQQSNHDNRLVRVAGGLFALVSLAAMLLVVGVAAEWVEPPAVEDKSFLIALIVAVAGLVIGVLSVIIARVRLDRLRRQRLTSGGSLVSGLSGAMYALDLGLLNDILTERRFTEMGNVRVKKSAGTGLTAVVLRDLLRLVRSPQPLLLFVVSIVVPYVLDSLGLSAIAAPLSAIALMAAVLPLLGGLRVFSRSGGMARSLPFSPGQIKRASIGLPAVLCIIWAFAIFPAYLGFGGAVQRSIPEALVVSELVAVAGLLGAVRWTIAKPINFSAPMVATQAGAMPPGMITNLVRGFDIALLITVPMVFNLPWWVSLIIAVICGIVLLGSFNMAEMQHRAKQQQAEMDRLKTGQGRYF